jgi:8-oxo-dGTP diphosphatase
MTNNNFTDSENILRMPVAVDLVVLTVKNDALCALVIRRGIKPFKGQWALPGGFVRPRESLEAAVHRELLEETGIAAARVGHIEQLATFGMPKRDPREQIISVAYLAFVPNLPDPTAGGDANEARITPINLLIGGANDSSKLAFDHDEILRVAIERTRAKLEYTSLATAFCAESFTINELRRVYEVVWGTTLDPANFHRKVTKTPGFIVATAETKCGEGVQHSGRPAQIYVQGSASLLHPALLRSGQQK